MAKLPRYHAKFISCLLVQAVFVATMPGCRFTTSEPETQESSHRDYFDKKLKCAEQLERAKARVARENKQEESNGLGVRTQIQILDACYSTTKNTCVSFELSTQIETRPYKIISEDFTARDMLTDAGIDGVTNFATDGRSAKETFQRESEAIRFKVGCAK